MGCVGRGGRGVASRPGRRKLRCEKLAERKSLASLIGAEACTERRSRHAAWTTDCGSLALVPFPAAKRFRGM